MKILEQIEGKKIEFGVGEVDENYLAIQSLFIEDKNKNLPAQFTSETSDKNSLASFHHKSNNMVECIICHNNVKETVFFPCGHRCACYNCALTFFISYKKCPKCNSDSRTIIKRIYD